MEAPRAVKHPSPLRINTQIHTHTTKKSSVTCSLAKPALAPGKTYFYPLLHPTSGSSGTRRHPVHSFSKISGGGRKCTLGTAIHSPSTTLFLSLFHPSSLLSHTVFSCQRAYTTNTPSPPTAQAWSSASRVPCRF